MKRLGFSSLLFLPCLLSLCLSDTAFGQTLTLTDPNNTSLVIDATHPLNYTNIAAGLNPATQEQVTVTASSFTSVTYKVAADPATGNPVTWLRLNNNTQGGPVNLNPSATMLVSIVTQGLVAGTYQSSFSLTITGHSTPAVTITVNLTVGSGGGILSANPNVLNFTANQGGTTTSPSSYSVLVSSSGNPLSFNLTTSYVGQTLNWVLLSAQTGTTGTAFTVSANPSGLNAGTFQANILAQSTTTADSVSISVTLIVGSTGTLTVSPANPPPFLYQVGGAQPQAQTITVTSSVGINFNINVSAGSNWLVPSSSSGSAGPNQNFTFTVSAATSGLALGTTNATLVLTPFAGNAQNVPFSIVVSNNPLLSVSPTLLTFSAGFSGTPPASQNVAISATGNGGAIGFQVTSDSAWLTPGQNQNVTPATLTVQVNQGSMAVGNYVGTLTVRPTNGDNYSIAITVNLAVGTTQQITAGPPTLLFSYQTTRNLPPAQTVTINSTGQPVSFTLGTQINTCPGSWLFAQALGALTTPATLQVQISAPGPTSGTCTGVITVTPSSGNPLQINVTVTIAATPLFTISMPTGFGNETIQQGSGSGVSRFIAVNSTDNSPLAFTATAVPVSGGNWLFESGQGNTPQNIAVIIQPGSLAAGVYTANIVITSSTLPGGSFTIPVQLTITPNVSITVTPGQLSFTAAQNGPAPATQTLTLTNSGGSPTFTAAISSNCQSLIGLDKTSGAATGNLNVSVLSTSGSVGMFNCQINFTYFNAASAGSTVQVTVTINTARTITVNTQSLAFAYQLTQPEPASQKITLSSTGGAVQFNVALTSSGWLAADTTSGTTPKDIQVSVHSSGLTVAGSPYTGQISITAPGVLTNPIVVTVTVTVTAAPNPMPVTVTSTATNLAGTIAAGELITIKGTLLGPTTAGGVLFTLNSSGGVNSLLAGVRVLFDGIPGTPIFVSAGQINVSVPYEIAGRLSTNIIVEYQGIQSAPLGVRVSDSAPGLFTLNSTGSGQIAAVNQNGTFNGPVGGGTTPASLGPTGTVVIVYGTGGGQTNPPGQTGSVTPVPQTASQLMKIPGIVSASVGGVAARVDFAGQAPGLVTGIMQFNLFLAPGTPTGNNQSVVITVNGISSSQGATIAVSP